LKNELAKPQGLGFNRIYMPNSQKSEVKIKNIELITISDITDFARKFLK